MAREMSARGGEGRPLSAIREATPPAAGSLILAEASLRECALPSSVASAKSADSEACALQGPGMHVSKRLGNPSVLNVLLVALWGCGAESPTNSVEREAATLGERSSTLETTCDPIVAAGDGWINRPVTSETGRFNVGWRSTPSGSSDGRPIDSVIGLSGSAAQASADLGPSVRFNANGGIDARDGDGYAGGFPYTFGEGPYEFQLLVDVPAHRYSVWVRHLDSPFKPFEVVARDAAFRTEQQALQSLANLGTVVESPAGAVQHCGYTHQPISGCSRSGPTTWQSRSFTTLGTQHVVLDFYAWVTRSAIDAVIGASLGAPGKFGDLAATVRFRPDGYIDARNGGTYAADAQYSYTPNTYYHFNMDIDLASRTYSVTLASDEQGAVVLARDYAFRTEQAGVASLDHLGQFVDSPAGDVNTCALVAH